MFRRVIVLGLMALLLMAFAGDAAAFCIRCDQSTGYWCYIRTDGNYTNCDSPTLAGCILWGKCLTGGPTCGMPKCPNQNGMLWSNDFKLASVAVSNAKTTGTVHVSANAHVAAR